MANKCVIVNSVEDVKHYLKEFGASNIIFLATHASPAIYLKEVENIHCLMLSEWIDDIERENVSQSISIAVDGLLSTLDKELILKSEEFRRFGIEFFSCLYGYIGKHIYLGYECLIITFERAVKELDINEIYWYKTNVNPFLSTSLSGIEDLANRCFSSYNISFLSSVQDSNQKRQKYLISMLTNFRKLRNRPKYIILKVIEKIKKHIPPQYSKNKKSILVSDHLYDLSFIPSLTNKYNFIYLVGDNTKIVGINKKNISSKLIHLSFVDKLLPALELLKDQILEDFTKYTSHYLGLLSTADEAAKRFQFSLAIWGVPPAWGYGAIVYAYLRKICIPVLGAQHGSNYGDTYHPWHFDSDFKRCDYWISYGASVEDFLRLYPNYTINPKILPFGSAKIDKFEFGKEAKKIDVFFPLTNSISFYAGGMSRISFANLARRQVEIIKFFEFRKNISTIAKPMPNADETNCAIIPLLENLKHVKYLKNISISDFYRKFHPKIIIIEYPSTPLYEALHLDIEIFLMNDPVIPFEYHALNELKKRVHFFEQTDKLLEAVEKFFEGELESKRDNTFLNHYVYKSNTKKNILDAIDKIIEGKL